MPFGKKCFYILSVSSIALNFLFLSTVLMEKRLLLNAEFSSDSNTLLNENYSSALTETSESVSDEQTSSQKSKISYDKDVYLTEISKYNDIVIPYSADKDENYIKETLFIGDSNTAGLSSFGYLPLQNVIGKKSMGIQGVTSNNFVWFKGYSKPVNIVNAVKLMKPRRIIINFGTNNTTGITSAEFINMYKNALRSIQSAYPYCDIIIAAVLPVGYYRENYNIKQSVIDKFNLSLAELCQTEGYVFLDYSTVFKNPDSGYMYADCVASDGIHLNNKGYHILLEYINDHQYITEDKRPDTKNIPVRTTVPQNDVQQTVNAKFSAVENSAETEENIDSTVISENSSSENEINKENVSDSSSDLGNIKEKEIYDPFL